MAALTHAVSRVFPFAAVAHSAEPDGKPATSGKPEDDDFRDLLAGEEILHWEGNTVVPAPVAGASLDLGALDAQWLHDSAPPLCFSSADDVVELLGLPRGPAMTNAFADDEVLDERRSAGGVDVVLIVDVAPGVCATDAILSLDIAIRALGDNDRVCLIDTDAPRRRSSLMRVCPPAKAHFAWLAARVRGAAIGAANAGARLAGALDIAASVLDDRRSCNSAARVILLSFGRREGKGAVPSFNYLRDSALFAAARRCCFSVTTDIGRADQSTSMTRALLACATLGFGGACITPECCTQEPSAVMARRVLVASSGAPYLFEPLGHVSQMQAFIFDAIAVTAASARWVGIGDQMQRSIPVPDPESLQADALISSLREEYPAVALVAAGSGPPDDRAVAAAMAALTVSPDASAATTRGLYRAAVVPGSSQRVLAPSLNCRRSALGPSPGGSVGFTRLRTAVCHYDAVAEGLAAGSDHA